jgi:hypothetical protein
LCESSGSPGRPLRISNGPSQASLPVCGQWRETMPRGDPRPQTLRDLYPQILRGRARSGVQLAPGGSAKPARPTSHESGGAGLAAPEALRPHTTESFTLEKRRQTCTGSAAHCDRGDHSVSARTCGGRPNRSRGRLRRQRRPLRSPLNKGRYDVSRPLRSTRLRASVRTKTP